MDLMERLRASLVLVHWEGDAPTSLHGNGPGHFREIGDQTTRDPAEVTCKLCLTLLARAERAWRSQPHTDPYCVSHCAAGHKHSQCGCRCSHRMTVAVES